MLPDLFIYYSHMEKEIEKKPPEFPITSNSKYLYFMYKYLHLNQYTVDEWWYW